MLFCGMPWPARLSVEAGKEGRAPHSQLPITLAILQKLRAVWLHSEPSFNSKMLWAASTVTFSLSADQEKQL